ncbi:hypothetical protein OE88DRAFT_1645693 [Heliocybe sulcata]|uniref:Uncharacterized protein n=1 Tax=Heliocybe sulcata TaxID=5364 RepID=A0A5C3N093_9AGAM|nr:hypothetical protein OE88DRAFT_1645693 [Heliocybe sulcata]
MAIPKSSDPLLIMVADNNAAGQRMLGRMNPRAEPLVGPRYTSKEQWSPESKVVKETLVMAIKKGTLGLAENLPVHLMSRVARLKSQQQWFRGLPRGSGYACGDKSFQMGQAHAERQSGLTGRKAKYNRGAIIRATVRKYRSHPSPESRRK